MVSKKIISRIELEAKSYFDSSRGSHGWDHVERVYNLAIHIAEKERANTDVVRVATLLHDIAREQQDKKLGRICHAEEGAKMAVVILKKYELPVDFVQNVSDSIASHRFRKNVEPKTLEAMVLRDADKLDSVGAVGIGRAFMFAGECGHKLHNREIEHAPLIDRSYTTDDTAYQEYLFKLSRIKNLMHTKEGKRIAKERHDFMEDFFRVLNAEVDGVR